MDPKRLYQIFKTCRLCGADGGYKMPIIQNLVKFDDEIDLQEQIRECVQIEVYEGDKMPPLICEFCIEKIDKYLQFKELCKETDMKTRKKLGLPLNGCSGTVELDRKIDNKQLSTKQEPEEIKIDLKKEKEQLKKEAALKQKESQIKVKTKELKTKEDNLRNRENKIKSLESQVKSRDEVLTELQEKLKKQEEQIKLKEAKLKENVPHIEKELKELKEKQAEWKKLEYSYKKKESFYKKKQEQMQKKANIEMEMLKQEISLLKEEMRKKKRPESEMADRSSRASSITSKPGKRKHSPVPSTAEAEETANQLVQPSTSKRLKESKSESTSAKKTKQSPPKAAVLPTPEKIEFERIGCSICQSVFKTKPARTNHMKCHTVTFTNPKLACDACKVWYTSSDEINSHHRQHKIDSIPYKCDFCNMNFTTDKDYQSHFTVYDCIRDFVVPDVQCLDCWQYFATETLKCGHECRGEDGRPGGKCGKCGVEIEAWKELIIHEATCKHTAKVLTPVKKTKIGLDNIKCDQEVLASLLPMEVRVIKCDNLLKKHRSYCNIREVKPDFGLDKNCVYPYSLHLRIKQEPVLPTDRMVAINPEVEDEFSKDYVHWDSDDFATDDEEIKVKSLTHSCLKVIFSNKMFGKVPKKRRKVKEERVFDSVADTGMLGGDFDCNIDNIIQSLEMDVDERNEGEINRRKDDKDEQTPSGVSSESTDKPSAEIDDGDGLKITIENSVEETKLETNDQVNDASNVTPMDTECMEVSVKDTVTPASHPENESNTNEKLDDTISLESIKTQDKTNCDVNKITVNKNENTKDFEKVDSSVFNENNLISDIIENITQKEEDVNATNIETDNDEESLVNIERNQISNHVTKHNGETDSEKCPMNVKDETSQEEETEFLSDQTKVIGNSMLNSDSKCNQNDLINSENNVKDSPVVNDTKAEHEKLNETDLEPQNEIEFETQNKTDLKTENETESITEPKLDDAVKPIERNGGSEMEALMQDLSDLSGIDEIQSKTSSKKEKYVEDKNADLEHKRFMKELDAQIGENSDSTTPPNEQLNECKEMKEGTQDQDLREINKQLQERMDRDLDNISDEEFNFDA